MPLPILGCGPAVPMVSDPARRLLMHPSGSAGHSEPVGSFGQRALDPAQRAGRLILGSCFPPQSQPLHGEPIWVLDFDGTQGSLFLAPSEVVLGSAFRRMSFWAGVIRGTVAA